MANTPKKLKDDATEAALAAIQDALRIRDDDEPARPSLPPSDRASIMSAGEPTAEKPWPGLRAKLTSKAPEPSNDTERAFAMAAQKQESVPPTKHSAQQLAGSKIIPFASREPAPKVQSVLPGIATTGSVGSMRVSSQERSSPMPTNEELFDAKLKTSEAQTETKIVRIEGKIDSAVATIGGKLDSLGEKLSYDHEYNRATRWVMIGLLITCTFALAGLVVTMATYGDAMFGRGMNVRDVVQSVIKDLPKQ
jgi:hypothetical protein